MLPVVHVRAADAGVVNGDEDVVGGGEGGDGAVFEGEGEGFVEDEGEVLGRNQIAVCCGFRSWEGRTHALSLCGRHLGRLQLYQFAESLTVSGISVLKSQLSKPKTKAKMRRKKSMKAGEKERKREREKEDEKINTKPT